MKQRAFTIVELLITMSILATLSIVAYISIAGHTKTVNNATRIASIDSLHLSLSDYLVLKNILPEPNSNYIAYDERWTYMHSSSGSYGSGVYGVSGHVTYDFLPKGYVNFEATDPESRQFYGYGKSLFDEKNPVFDVAAVIYDGKTGGYKTYLRGTYQKPHIASLIRSYSSSNFVSQDSTENLPYNPYERKVTATVLNFSGSLTLANSNGSITSIVSPATYTGELNTGDTLTLGTGSTALLHISDGSELSLGSTLSQTILDLNTLSYSDDNNLVSKVALWLKSGEVWVEAPHLRTEADSASDFSIQTDSAVAAVRGTVFGMTKNPVTNITTISLKIGKIEVQKITTIGGKITFNQAFTDTFSYTATWGFVLEYSPASSMKSYMIVPEGGTPIKLDGITNNITWPGISTGTLTPSEIDKKINHPPFSLGYRPKAYKIEFSTGATTYTGILSVTYDNPGADSYELYFSTGFIYANNPFPNPIPSPSYTGTFSSTGIVTITGAFAYEATSNTFRHYYLRVCYRGQCSAPDIKTLGWNVFSFQNFKVWGERQSAAETGPIPATPPPCSTDPSKPEFWTSGCLTQTSNSGLVAYAPYDTAGNLNMYTGSTSQYITPVSNGILNQNFTDLHIFPTYILSTSAPAAGMARTFTGWFEESYGTSEKTELWISEYLSGSSFFHFIGGGGGIFLDNWNIVWGDNKSDSLKYDLTPLNLTGSFSIEMSVRGSALKRPGWPYFLATTDVSNKYLVWLSGGKLYFGINTSSGISKTISELGMIQDNNFYKITGKTINTNTATGSELVIKDTSWNIIFSWTWMNIPIPNNGQLFVWSNNASLYQWNDIIDYIKVYKYE